ncbi:hypothetical protein C1H46_003270 [Malus baccata]|uniref:Uncharacterized protein n=1 Tax=Malus baccata TaxID=106549 RepID=A0A540NJQ2_MALBA|nr:hypothetical protein C1H46_003270 [Malus baccata]
MASEVAPQLPPLLDHSPAPRSYDACFPITGSTIGAGGPDMVVAVRFGVWVGGLFGGGGFALEVSHTVPL